MTKGCVCVCVGVCVGVCLCERRNGLVSKQTLSQSWNRSFPLNPGPKRGFNSWLLPSLFDEEERERRGRMNVCQPVRACMHAFMCVYVWVHEGERN